MKLLFILLLLLLLRLISSSTANLAFLFLAILAAFGGKNTIYAFLMSWFFTLINPILAPDPGLGAIGRYLIIFSGFLSLSLSNILSRKMKISKYSLLTFLLGLVILLHSILTSYFVLISTLKLITWLLTVLTLLGCWSSFTLENKEIVYNKIVLFLKFILIISVPFLLIPQIGFARNANGFQGVLNHPQAFGPTIAILGIIIGGKILSSRKISYYDIITFIICLVFIFLSEARTAGLGLILGLGLTLILNPILSGKSFFNANPIFKNKWLYIYSYLIAIFGFIFSSLYIDQLNSYLFKRTDSGSILEAAENSRGKLVENMLFNIEANPFKGIGFGMPSDINSLNIEYDPFFGLPISAAIEKGVLPIAVLEELGIILGSFVFLWIFYSFYKAAQVDAQKLSILICIILLNLGEYMFFSVGGMGMLMLVLFTASTSYTKK